MYIYIYIYIYIHNNNINISNTNDNNNYIYIYIYNKRALERCRVCLFRRRKTRELAKMLRTSRSALRRESLQRRRGCLLQRLQRWREANRHNSASLNCIKVGYIVMCVCVYVYIYIYIYTYLHT